MYNDYRVRGGRRYLIGGFGHVEVKQIASRRMSKRPGRLCAHFFFFNTTKLNPNTMFV